MLSQSDTTRAKNSEEANFKRDEMQKHIPSLMHKLFIAIFVNNVGSDYKQT